MNSKKFDPFPVLSTPHLMMRQLIKKDRPALFRLRNDESVCRYIARAKETKEKEAAVFIKRINGDIDSGRLIFWAICQHQHHEVIGTICLWNFSGDEKTAELGYEMLPEYNGRGWMSEAVTAVLVYGFEKCILDKMEAYTHRDNQRSKRLLVKFGFELQGKIDPENVNNEVYAISMIKHHKHQTIGHAGK